VNWQEMLDGTVSGSFQHPALHRLALPNFSGWEPGRVWGEWDFDPKICNLDGALFGGYLAALADATAGHAVATTLGAEEGFATAGPAHLLPPSGAGRPSAVRGRHR